MIDGLQFRALHKDRGGRQDEEPGRPGAHASTRLDRGRDSAGLKDAIAARERIAHPEAEDLGFLYGVIFVGPPEDPGNHSRNVCVFGDAQVDRSPTGTGVSARAALHRAQGELALGEPFVVESILGTTFTGRPLEATRVGDVPAVIPRVQGTGYIAGRAEYFLDPRDPLSDGVILQ